MRHGNEVNGATRITFLRSIWFRIVRCLAWMLSGTIPHPRLGSICFMSGPFQEHSAEISAIRQGGVVEQQSFVSEILHPMEQPCCQGNFTAAAPGWHFLRSFCACRALCILWEGWGQDPCQD